MEVSYPKLSDEQKEQVGLNLEVRRSRYVMSVLNDAVKSHAKVVIVGDRPGNAAPLDPNYHHTPFYSTKHCSGWLNALLLVEGINEGDLIWINAYDKDGNPNDYALLNRIMPKSKHVIALGGNAAKWLRKGGYEFVQTTHPQFHKRFRNKQPYDLPTLINQWKASQP